MRIATPVLTFANKTATNILCNDKHTHTNTQNVSVCVDQPRQPDDEIVDNNDTELR